MSRFRDLVRGPGLIAATAIGAGTFALPYVFYKSGWALSLAYLLVLGLVMAYINYLYWRTLVKVGERKRLLGLAGENFGKLGLWGAFISLVVGLIVSLVVLALLAANFLTLIFSGLSIGAAIIIFWILGSIPIIVGLRRFVGLELLGGVLLTGIIAFIFISAFPLNPSRFTGVIDWNQVFLPFGAILFALAGWTAIEPIYNFEREKNKMRLTGRWPEFLLGNALPVLVYFGFVLAVLSSAAVVAPDTLSGLGISSGLGLGVLGAFGLIAIWTTYMSMGLEAKNLVEKDLGWPKIFSAGLVVFIPIILIYLGLRNFIEVIGLVGGVFLALQYLVMIVVGNKVLKPKVGERVFLNILSIIFALAIVYEIYYFVVGG